MSEELKKSEKTGIQVKFDAMTLDPTLNSADPISLVLQALKKDKDLAAIKLSFDVDPARPQNSYSIYKPKLSLIPNVILKQIRDTEELIGGIIIPLRARQISSFAGPRANRFDIGYAINFKPEMYSKYDEKQRDHMKQEMVPKIRELLKNCGSNEGVKDSEKRTLRQFMMEITEDILTYGWFATEIRKNELNEFHSFRAVDAGTIYKTVTQKGKSREAQQIREQACKILAELEDTKIDTARFEQDEYTWVQVIDQKPQQAFSDDEMLVWSLSPSTDITRGGYPVSPVERIISAITTHINLTTHNKMYFLNGRAARSIMVFKTDNLEEADLSAIRAQMQAHINSSNAAWRMPVFGVGPQDEIDIKPMDSGGRDMEFQYLADLNKRMILSAFQMSPDEISALSYLSRGTNSQSMSESNNEYKLVAARDSGLRPLLMSISDFLNERLLPKINPEWARIFRIDLEGIDSDTPVTENSRLQVESTIFLSMNDILDRVEKEHVPLAGAFPLNQAYMQVLEKYFTKGQILKSFGGSAFKDSDKDPSLDYCIGDQISSQIFMMKQQSAMQPQGQSGQPGQPPQDGQDGQDSGQRQQLSSGQDLDSAIQQLSQSLSKSEQALPSTRKELLKRHKAAKKKIVDDFEQQSKDMVDSIMGAITGKDDHDH